MHSHRANTWLVGSLTLSLLMGAATAANPIIGAVLIACLGSAFLGALIISRGWGGPASLLILLMTVSTPMPVLLQAGLYGGVAFFCLYSLTRRPPAALIDKCIAVLPLLICATWILMGLAVHGQALSDSLAGSRKTTFALLGICLGVSVRPEQRAKLTRVALITMVASLGISVIIHEALPGIERSIPRSAASATESLGGIPRLVGIFAGPFHVAMLAAFVLVEALMVRRVSGRTRILRLLIVTLAGAALYLAQVRTGVVAALIAMMVLVLLPTAGRVLRNFGRRLLALGTTSVTVLVVLSLDSRASGLISSIANYSSDSRFTNRYESWSAAWSLIRERPLLGHGPGTASDVVGSQAQAAGVHVTTHNLALKIAVEGGAIGLVLVGLLVLLVLFRLEYLQLAGHRALLSLTILFVFGSTGSAVEALPVSFLLFLFLGLGLRTSNSEVDGVSVEQIMERSNRDTNMPTFSRLAEARSRERKD